MENAQPAPRRYLGIGRTAMALSALGMAASAAVAYPFAENFSLGTQVAAHLALPVSAAFFKLGYVVRLAAHHAMDNYQAG
jgi:hypothetical protein